MGTIQRKFVAYGLMINKCAETVTKLMEVKRNQSQASHVESVVIHKDFSEIKAVKSVLPEAYASFMWFKQFRELWKDTHRQIGKALWK